MTDEPRDMRADGFSLEIIRLDTIEVFRLSASIAFSEQPTFKDLERVRRLGFRTVVNVRLPTEQPPEGSDVGRVGLRYLHLPVPSVGEIDEAHFVRFAAALRAAGHHTLPVLVHSAEGARAGVLALTWLAGEEGWSLEHLQRRATALGLDLPYGANAYLRSLREGRTGTAPSHPATP